MASLKNHPGMWLRDDAAAAINALEAKYGTIRINSAGRTVAEQADLIRRFDRGEPGIYIPARPPETSSHVRNGGEAVDVYNYTTDRAKLQEFGFEWFGPRDKVHYTFRGRPSAPVPARSAATAMLAWRWNGIQEMLRRHYGYTGSIDGIPGAGTVRAFQRFLRAKGYRMVAVDGVFGVETCKGAQAWLKATGRYGGAIDGIPGAGTRAGWDRAERENAAAF